MGKIKPTAVLIGLFFTVLPALLAYYVFFSGNVSWEDIQRNGLFGVKQKKVEDAARPTQSTEALQTVFLSDPTLDRAVKTSLGLSWNEGVPLETAQKTTQLIITDGPISNLSGIEAFTNLEVLVLDPCYDQPVSTRKEYFEKVADNKQDVNSIVDFTPLLSLGKLRTLVIFCNTCTDIETISRLKTLTHLRLSGQYVGYENGDHKDDNDAYIAGNRGDLEDLARLTNLETLDLSHNYVVDFTPLQQLPKLRRLNATENGTNAREVINSTLDGLRKQAEVQTEADWPLTVGDVQ